MIDLQARPRHKEGIIAQQVSGTAVLLNPEDGQYYALNEVGARVWDLSDGTHTVADIISLISQEYEAARKTIAADVIELLEDLQSEQLLITSTA